MKLIVLDLDSTLLYTSGEEDCEECGGRYTLEFDDGKLHGIWRPGYVEFLKDIASKFDVAIWSAGDDEYVHKLADMIKKVIPIKFVMSKSDCEYLYDTETGKESLQKPLGKIFSRYRDYFYNNTVIVDDNHYVAFNNPVNHIKVEVFDGDPEDNELKNIMALLHKYKDVEDIFFIKK